ncbi:MAG TPA: MATE family efflux transporter [Candidatus Angelobacter sp.]
MADMKSEFRPMLRLALPLALTELSWIVMGLVDTMMVGRLPYSAVAIGAVSLGGIFLYTVGIFGSSIMLGLDTLVAQAYGADRLEDCHRAFWNALYVALVLGPALMVVVLVMLPFLNRFGIDPQVLAYTAPFVKIRTLSAPPLVLYFVFRRYLQSMAIVKPVVFASVSANVVNLLGNWSLVYGHLGFPALGVSGSGWSTLISRIYMAIVLAIAVVYYDHKRASGLWRTSQRLEVRRIREMLRLGVPAATQLLLEISAFTVTTVLIARLGAVPLAGNQIALNVASITFMVPLGIGSAAAVRVGQAIGAHDPHGAVRSGWMALLFGTTFMFFSALTLFLFPRAIARIYSPDPQVIRMGAALLVVAAVFQLFDGLQVVTTGALRGAGNTRTPMYAHLLGYWIIGMPLGAILCFKFGLGAVGFWSGLCVAIVLIGSLLLFVWRRVTLRLISSDAFEFKVQAQPDLN